MHEEAVRMVAIDTLALTADDPVDDQQRRHRPVKLSYSAQTKRKKMWQRLLNHWSGLTVFVDHPQVPMDNNLAENILRPQVVGRKNYYGSGSIWSAQLAAALFSILQTLLLWDINPRRWLTLYLEACAHNGAKVPVNIDSFVPWSMDQTQRAALNRAYPTETSAAASEGVPINDSS